MGFFNSVFKKVNSEEESKAAEITTEAITTNPTIEELNRFFSWDSSIQDSKLYSSTYYACMQIRCNAIAKLPIKIVKKET